MSRAQLTSTVEQNIGGAVAPYVAGKNKIINGDFGVWQRGTSFSSPSGNSYTADRWKLIDVATTGTISRQAFTVGQTTVPGNPQYFMRIACTTAGAYPYRLIQPIEAPDAFSGRTFTLSFWAKTPDTGNIGAVYLSQYPFVSGARTDTKIDDGTISLTSSWQKYTIIGTFLSTAGKTLDANTYASVEFYVTNGNSKTVDIANVQLEAGSVATPFTTATGTIQGELAACQRYYWRANAFAETSYPILGFGAGNSATQARTLVPFPVQMRIKPVTIDYSTVGGFYVFRMDDTQYQATGVSIDTNLTTAYQGWLSWAVASGLTANTPYYVRGNNNSSYYLGFSAEL